MAIKIGANLPSDPEFWPNLFLPGLPVLNIVFTPGTLPIVCYVPPQPLLSFQGLATLSTNVFLQAQVEKVDVVSQSWSLPKLFGAVLADMLAVGWSLFSSWRGPLNCGFPVMDIGQVRFQPACHFWGMVTNSNFFIFLQFYGEMPPWC